MNAPSRITLLTLAGFIAGALTWMFVDISGLIRLSDVAANLTPRDVQNQFIASSVFGGLLGLCLGAVEGMAAGSTAHLWRASAAGAVVGVVAGAGGLAWGMGLFGALYTENASNPATFLLNVFARAIGWAFIGAFVGTTEGWRKRSFRIGKNGFLGGLIGGLIGGMVFEMIPYLTPGLRRSAVLSRLFAFTITGSAVGFFIGLVQQLFKSSWIRVMVGRNEGREFLLDGPRIRIGRDELADVPLFGNPQIAKTHAVLAARASGGYEFTPDGSEPGVRINNQPLHGATVLRDGDRIEIADRLLIYHERFSATRTTPERRDISPQPTAAAPSRALADALPAPGAATAPPLRQASAAVPTGAAFTLQAVAGPHTGMVWPLAQEVAIGRDAANGIALSGDGKASRVHARIRREGGNYVLEDAGSTNGTFVNGMKIEGRQPLVNGDTIMIGTTALRVDGPSAGKG